MPVEMVQFSLKLLLKQIILAVYHDFHWLLAATKLLTTKLHSDYIQESEILKRTKLKILPLAPQPWLQAQFPLRIDLVECKDILRDHKHFIYSIYRDGYKSRF